MAEIGQQQTAVDFGLLVDQMSDMQNFHEQQRLVDAELVQAMIESTPDSWEQIGLALTRASPRATGQVPGQSDFGNLRHELFNSQGHGHVGPADSLFVATYKLDELLQGAQGFLVKAVYVAKQEGGSWTYKADLEYG